MKPLHIFHKPKPGLLALLLLTLCLHTHAQRTEESHIPITIGYFGQLAVQPGIRVGTEFLLGSKDVQRDRKGGMRNKTKHLYIAPQIAFYGQQLRHNSLLLNGEFGYRSRIAGGKLYGALGAGLGYLSKWTLTGLSVSLSDGRMTRNYERTGAFLPSLSGAFGGDLSERLGWYARGTFGWEIGAGRGTALTTFLELGLRFAL